MIYKLSFGKYSGIFAMPACAVDKYINDASKNDLKVLLYIFRNSGAQLDTALACAALAINCEQLEFSLGFWQQRGVFSCSVQKSAESSSEQAQQNAAGAEREKTFGEATAQKIPAQNTPAHRVIETPVQYGQEEIAKKSQSNAEIKFLLETVPNQLGRLISPAECSALVYLYEGAGLPADVIIMIVGYCVSCGKLNMRYIEKMAVSWAEEGIDTYERAENKLRELEKRRSYEGQIRAIMGINDRALTPTERQHIARWNGWNQPPELIKLAYDIGVARTGKLSFSYINSILSSWHDKGYKTVEQAKNENKHTKGARRGAPGKSPSYDIDEYVRLSMKTLHNE